MSFSADWLDLREPFDRTARDEPTQAACGSAVSLLDGLRAARRADGADAWPIIDLGGGTGANLRWLAPRLGGCQRWRVLDHDAALLGELPARVAAWAAAQGLRAASSAGEGITVSAPSGEWQAQVVTELTDLATGIGDFTPPPGALVTASALLDLVSAAWFDLLAARCRQANAAMLFALNYDGRIDWQPADPDDAAVRAAVNAHQRRDKGFGAALGPMAAAHAEQRLRQLGYRVRSAASDWRIGPADTAMAGALLAGWAQAAIEAEPARQVSFEQWQRRRAEAIARGAVRLTVGHIDIAAHLP